MPAVATGSTAGRTLADRFADVVNVKDYGAKCDGLTNDATAFQAALAKIASGGTVIVPAGTCLIGAALSQAITSGSAFFVGAGSSATTLSFTAATDGIAFALSPGATAAVRSMTIARTVGGGAYANTGLSIVTTLAQTTTTGVSSIQDVRVMGNASRTTGWLIGININNVNTVSFDHVVVSMPDATGAGVGTGILIAGKDGTSYAVEEALHDITVEGGGKGLEIGDYVQGVYVSDSRLIGDDYGIYWNGTVGIANELLEVTNSHFNSGTRGMFIARVSWVGVTNTLTLHFPTTSVTGNWIALGFDGCGNMTIKGNAVTGRGASYTGAFEDGIYITSNVTPVAITGNSLHRLKDYGIWLASGTSGASVTGNSGWEIGSNLLVNTSGSTTNQTIGNSNNNSPDLTMDVAGTALIPPADNTIKLGNVTRRWETVYASNYAVGIPGSPYAILFGDASGDVVSSGALFPDATNTRNLGSTSIRWKSLFLSGNAAIAGSVSLDGNFSLNGNVVSNAAAPTVSAACTSPTVTASNGTWGFVLQVGTSCTGVKTATLGMPAATTGWTCNLVAVTDPGTRYVAQTGGAASTVTFASYSRTTGAATDFTDGDVIRGSCFAY